MNGDPLSILASWEDFLPPNAVVMAKRRAAESVAAEPILDAKAPEPLAATANKNNANKNKKIGFEASDLDDPAARALFEKIRIALELRADEVEVFATAPADFAEPILIRFAATAAESATVGVWDGVGPTARLTTFSLGAMLADPGLKKSVWSHLKEAVARVR